jgi:hypothetical protein
MFALRLPLDSDRQPENLALKLKRGGLRHASSLFMREAVKLLGQQTPGHGLPCVAASAFLLIDVNSVMNY